MSLLEIKAGEKLYVIYPAAITTHEFEEAEKVANRVRALTGVRPVLVCDRDPAAVAAVPEDAPAVLIGNNICPECQAVLNRLNYGEARIKLVGRRVVIAAHIDRLLGSLVTELTDGFEKTADGYSFKVKERKIKDDNYLHLLPVMKKGRIVAYHDSTDEYDMVVMDGTDKRKFKSYVKLLSSRFNKEWEREIAGNLFATFTDDKVAVRVYYTPYNKHTRVSIEPVANFYRPDNESFESIVPPLMTTMGRRFAYNLRYLGKDSGAGQMSYCMRLSDGSFVVYDCGLNTDAFGDAIWNVMNDQAPDKDNIVIAAWIFSHTHIDHVGGFLNFEKKYADKVKLERVMFNFPSMTDAWRFREAWNLRLVKEALTRSFPDAVYSKLHTGDIVKVRDAEFEVLFTVEDLTIQYLSMATTSIYNNCSLVSRMTLGGQTMMFMGDAQDEANTKITAMYGKYLKSDMLQVCHHGGVGGTCDLYRLIDPDVAFFSTTDELLPEYLKVRYNNQLVYDQHVKQIFNSAENTLTFELPYTPGECNIPDFEGEIVDKLSSSCGGVVNIKKSATK